MIGSERRPSLAMLVALAELPGIGQTRRNLLLKDLKDPANLDLERLAQVQRTAGLPVQPPDLEAAHRVLDRTDRLGAELIGIHEPAYPPSLSNLHDPPHLLWALGDPALMRRDGFAVVGTRNPSDYGRIQTRKFAYALARLDLVIVSGMALGVDTLAHAAALDAGGLTIGVLPTGIDRLYPESNRPLARRILDSGGLLLSENPPGKGGSRHMFPRRNRIVAGLSIGVLVTDSAEKGGSLITADCAVEQGRHVFSIPHRIGEAKGAGCNALIRESRAVLTQSVQDIVVELNQIYPHNLIPKEALDRLGQDLELTDEQSRILAAIGETPVTVDELSGRTGIGVGRLYQLVLELKLLGRLRQTGGRMLRKC